MYGWQAELRLRSCSRWGQVRWKGGHDWRNGRDRRFARLRSGSCPSQAARRASEQAIPSKRAFFITVRGRSGLSTHGAIDRIDGLQGGQVAPGPAGLHSGRVVKEIAGLGQVETVCGQAMRGQGIRRSPEIPQRHLVIVGDAGHRGVDADACSSRVQPGWPGSALRSGKGHIRRSCASSVSYLPISPDQDSSMLMVTMLGL